MMPPLPDKSTKRWLIGLFLIWLGFVLVSGWSLDSGFHWDEGVQIRLVQQTVATADLLPHWYNYPSVSYWLSLASLLPHLPAALTADDAGAYLAQVTAVPSYFMSIKTIFLLTSSLAILWVGLAARAQGLSQTSSLVSTAVVATSWEVGYHLRWIAPDGIVMMWGALWILLISRPDDKRRLHGAAVVAGLAAGTKYPAGLLLLPTMALVLLLHKPKRWLFYLPLACGLAFVVSTPGAVWDTAVFVQNIQWEIAHYAQGHYGYTIAPGLPHLWRMAQYVGLILLAPFKPLALFWLALAVVGVWVQWRRQRDTAVSMLLFALLYIAYFSQQQVMIVRNLLILMPFLALWVGWGAEAIWHWGRILSADDTDGTDFSRANLFSSALSVFQKQRNGAKEERAQRFSRKILSFAPFAPLRDIQKLVVTYLIAALLVNASWSVYAAITIQQRLTPEVYTAALAHFITTHPERTFHLSPRVAEALAPYGTWPNASPNKGETVVVFALEAFPEPTDWPANDPFLIERQFGPYEINFPYYPSWVGNDRIVLLRK
ncbi:MAG: hypothetical protein KDD89_08800 [Anaerolineales bacterium]|nr:hypothetical protein [Anaerolineales bacterium]